MSELDKLDDISTIASYIVQKNGSGHRAIVAAIIYGAQLIADSYEEDGEKLAAEYQATLAKRPS